MKYINGLYNEHFKKKKDATYEKKESQKKTTAIRTSYKYYLNFSLSPKKKAD